MLDLHFLFEVDKTLACFRFEPHTVCFDLASVVICDGKQVAIHWCDLMGTGPQMSVCTPLYG